MLGAKGCSWASQLCQALQFCHHQVSVLSAELCIVVFENLLLDKS